MKKVDENYIYVREMGYKTVNWKFSEIKWSRFADFIKKELVNPHINLLWYQDARDDIKNLKPKELDEPEESEDERHPDENLEEQQTKADLGNKNENVGDEIDDGDDVVLDAGDGASDERFRLVFEEGTNSKIDVKEANKGDVEEEESDPIFGLGDELYPDTPLESDEE
ncbi:unnamed protein product [Arabis nemorensis]|uniref:Uncharacterized protein n=1 Tax=Arabis nemorensis TaxID=586526 RepID=A0A565CQ64_9BRAS|nr:unnamed protein product [Arabis nemorensis]